MKRLNVLVLATLVASLLSVGGCGGGGNGDDEDVLGVDYPSGSCGACNTTTPCAGGLLCQMCTDNCPDTSNRCAGLSSATAPLLNCGEGRYPVGCINIAGRWTITETIFGSACTVGGQNQSIDQTGTVAVDIVQDGCKVSYTRSTQGISVTRSGRIVGNRMRLRGTFVLAVGANAQYSKNEAIVDGIVNGTQMNLSGSGEAEGSAQGIGISCHGMSTATGVR